MAYGEKLVGTAAKMYECRDTMRTLLGSGYQDTMKQLAGDIRAVAQLKRTTEIEALVLLAKKADDPMMSISLMAAYVEMTEPSDTPCPLPARSSRS
jgi:hypothetical protein